MTTLTEVIDGFKGVLKEDSLEGTKELKAYLEQQPDYSASKEDFAYLLSVRKKLDIPEDSEVQSRLFREVLFDYIIKGISEEDRGKFRSPFYSICFDGLSFEEDDKTMESIRNKGVPDLSNAIARCNVIIDSFKDYVRDSPDALLGETAHYVNNSISDIFCYLGMIQSDNSSK
jgi:hypothetical protein